MRRVALLALCLLGAVLVADCRIAAAAAYADPRLLDVGWGNYSFVRQAWRGYLETLPATHYLNGLGVVWTEGIPGRSDEQAAEALAWAGFRRVRLEVPWGSVRWDEDGFDQGTAARLRQVLAALRKNGLRPLILLNANDGQPCPVRRLDVRVEQRAPKGSRVLITAAIVGGLGDLPAEVMSLAEGGSPGPLISRHDTVQGRSTLELSMPLAREVKAGEVLRVAVLKYPPLYPVGTTEFDETAQGWLKYVSLVLRTLADSYGSDDYDVEIWNELTFGSAFLDVNNYCAPKLQFRTKADFLHPGGAAWELGRRTVALIKSEAPRVKVIWGFSNTTFFHTPIAELPPGLDGQSYHPYGTGRRCYADLIRGRERLLLDDFIPTGCSIQPEGYAHTWQQTESLMRLIAPAVRAVRPAGSTGFEHYITEHGFAPIEIGITDANAARVAKEKFLLRAPLLWLNKGITALYVFHAYEPDDSGMGMFDGDGTMSPAMRTLHAITARLSAATAVGVPRQVTIERVVRDKGPVGVFENDKGGRYVRQSDLVALLPFQVNAARFVLGAYVMTQDFPRDLAPQAYHLTIGGLQASRATVDLFIPSTGEVRPLEAAATAKGALTIAVPLTDVPRLIEIQEAGAS
jgi:hypothetical protein